MPDQYGTCEITRHDDGTITVDRADPRITITDELMEEFAAGNHHPAATLTGDQDRITRLAQGDHRADGPEIVLTIDASNRRVIYRISDYLLGTDRYIAEWPD